ncbi:MAG: CHASE sensor domain-containing protein, partial [Bacteroidota bacterium]
MASFQNISIRNKLTVIQTIATFIAVLLCCVIFVYNDISAFKDSSKSNKYSIAEIVGENSMAALVFNDKDAANKILLRFNDNPSILNAVILDKSGKEFARYIKKGEETFPFSIPDGTSVIMEKFFEQKFIVSYRIFQEKEFIGTVMLRAELIDLPTIILKYIKVAIIVLLLSIVTALIISAFFQRIITKPLLSLVKKTKEVSETDNYSIRSSFKGTDEIGVLSEGFNNMLGQIEKTQKAIKDANLNLEERVKERTASLAKTQTFLQLSEEKYRKLVEEAGDVVYTSDFQGRFTYINPMSQKLTGYTENEMTGKLFLEVIAPEWKEKVAKFYKEQFDKRIKETTFSFPIITKSGEKKWIEQT